MLIERGADVHKRDNNGKTALKYARQYRRPQIRDLFSNFGIVKKTS